MGARDMKKAFAAERKNDSGPRTALGTLLIEEGVIDSDQLEEALRLGAESGERLGEVLVRMGWASEEDLARILAHQWNLRCLERSAISFDPNALAKLSREDATTLEALPMRIADDGSLVIAVAEPTEARLFALRSRFGDRIECVVIPKTALDVGLRSDLLAKTSPSPKREEVSLEVVEEQSEPEQEQTEEHEPKLELELVPGLAIDESETESASEIESAVALPADPAVVAEFDETAGALSSLVEEQLQTLRAVVVQAEEARAKAEAGQAKAETAQMEALAEIARLRSEIGERESSVRELQKTLHDVADKLLPPPSLS
jgi:Type II secretion system (T2SS), protein E, N-terminal domain